MWVLRNREVRCEFLSSSYCRIKEHRNRVTCQGSFFLQNRYPIALLASDTLPRWPLVFILNFGGDLYLIPLVDTQLHTLTRLANHWEEKGGDLGPVGPCGLTTVDRKNKNLHSGYFSFLLFFFILFSLPFLFYQIRVQILLPQPLQCCIPPHPALLWVFCLFLICFYWCVCVCLCIIYIFFLLWVCMFYFFVW